MHRLVLAILGLLAGLVAGEGLVRLTEWSSRAGPVRFLSDPELGQRPAPHTGGGDARGYRNARALTNAEIVAIGDSQTWGVNADMAEAWPQQLGRIVGRPVYNMSTGGYGVAHYHALLARGLALHPRVVIVGLYLGNDLYDTYRLVYGNALYKPWRMPNRPDLLDDTVAARADDIWNREKAFQRRYGRDSLSLWPLWVRGHTAVGRLLDRAGVLPGKDAWFQIGRAWAQAYPTEGAFYDDERVRTVFTTGYRRLALDLADPRVAEGLRLTVSLQQPLQERTRRAGARLVVVLIPTKEGVFAAVPRGQRPLSPSYSSLVQNETRCREAILAAAKDADIAAVDVLGPLSRAVGRGQQVYPVNIESHPNRLGYWVIAEAVAAKLREMEY